MKCWKKIGKHFETKDGNQALILVENMRLKPKTYYYELSKKHENGNFRFTGQKLKNSKTKSIALNFAKSYMKKHDVC